MWLPSSLKQHRCRQHPRPGQASFLFVCSPRTERNQIDTGEETKEISIDKSNALRQSLQVPPKVPTLPRSPGCPDHHLHQGSYFAPISKHGHVSPKVHFTVYSIEDLEHLEPCFETRFTCLCRQMETRSILNLRKREKNKSDELF